MSFRDILCEIEGYSFAARVNLASDFDTFSRAVASENAVQELSRLLQRKEYADELLKRTAQLCCQSTDFRHEHPKDAAIATYILTLSGRYMDLAKIAAESATIIPRSWWARRAAELILSNRYLASSVDRQTSQMEFTHVPEMTISASSTVYSEQQTIAMYVSVFLANEARVIVATGIPVQQHSRSLPVGLGTFQPELRVEKTSAAAQLRARK